MKQPFVYGETKHHRNYVCPFLLWAKLKEPLGEQSVGQKRSRCTCMGPSWTECRWNSKSPSNIYQAGEAARPSEEVEIGCRSCHFARFLVLLPLSTFLSYYPLVDAWSVKPIYKKRFCKDFHVRLTFFIYSLRFEKNKQNKKCMFDVCARKRCIIHCNCHNRYPCPERLKPIVYWELCAITFQCHGNGLRVTPGELHSSVPIHNQGLTSHQPQTASEHCEIDMGTHKHSYKHTHTHSLR